MTTVTLTSTETRHQKALALLADRGQWLTVRGRDGREFVGIPSQTIHGLVHLVASDASQCDCYDFRNSGRGCCKHTLARKLDLIARGAEPQPASDITEGLVNMAADKGVLEMVVEEDGDLTWRPVKAERRELDRILGRGKPKYETDHVAAARYDEIFKPEDDGPRGLKKESYL